MTLKENIRETLDNHGKTSFTKKQLFDALGVTDRTMAAEVIGAMDSLCADGVYMYDDKAEKYRKINPKEYVVGTVQGHARGFGFCIDRDAVAPDLFITHARLHGALHMDKVLVKILPGTRDEGEVVKILGRGLTQIVGTLDKQRSAFVVPDDGRFASDVYVPRGKLGGAVNGQKVVVRITAYPKGKSPEGEIVKVIGYPGGKGNGVVAVVYVFVSV